MRSFPPIAASLIQEAEHLARTVHEGQLDRQGQPYIGHPERVAAQCAAHPAAHCVAWLHDVVEKTTTTLTDLALTYPATIVDAVDAISRRPGESLESYCERISVNPLAQFVKFADLRDNSDEHRLAALPQEVRSRLRRQYALTYQLIMPCSNVFDAPLHVAATS